MTGSEFKALERKYELHIPYHNGYENGYADAEAKWLSVIEKITTEIEELTKCPYGTECLGANCPTNTDCMICGEHVLDIIDKAVKEYTHERT